MKRAPLLRALVPAVAASAAVAVQPGRAQCPSDLWTLYSAVGNVSEIALVGTVAWIAAEGGVVRIDLAGVAQGTPSQFRVTVEEGLASPDVTAMTIDGFGNVYVGTRRNGVSVFDPGGRLLADLSSFGGLLWGDKVSSMDAIGDTTGTWMVVDGDNLRPATGDRILVASADRIASTGEFEGGGLKGVVAERTASGGFRFLPEEGIGHNLPDSRDVLSESTASWIGTRAAGLWRLDSSGPPRLVLDSDDGLVSRTVNTIVRAPDHTGGSALWLGTPVGLQSWNGATLTNVDALGGRAILDLWHAAGELWVVSEGAGAVRDLHRFPVSSPSPTPQVVPRITCLADTFYAPTQVAVDGAGRVALGTQADAFGVRQGGAWICPPSLGPHSATIADMELSADGTLYFGTGTHPPTRPNGLGWFDGTSWNFVTPSRDPVMLNANTTQVEKWPDGSIWLASTVDRLVGGVNRLFPATGEMVRYAPAVVDPNRRMLGRNVWGMTLDGSSNLWVAFGQTGGGLSVVEHPDGPVTSFPFDTIYPSLSTLLRGIAVDSRGRIWTTTTDTGGPAQLFVVNTRGTLQDLSDDRYDSFNIASEIADIGTVPFVAISSADVIWMAGEKGLVRGQIGADVGGRPAVGWETVRLSTSQVGARNPLPFTTGSLDWNEDLWLGTASTGLVRISQDLTTWSWFDAAQGCPLPDATVSGLFIDEERRRVYVGTASGGIAVIDVGQSGTPLGGLDPRPFPNPWRPRETGTLSLAGIPATEIVTLRIYSVSGELVHEVGDVAGPKTWNGRNLGDQLVESGVYVVTAVTREGTVYEGKVAVIR